MNYENCICYQCRLLTEENFDPDCACGETPYWTPACFECPKKSFCDVALNPDRYEE